MKSRYVAVFIGFILMPAALAADTTQRIVPIDTPVIVIHASGHGMHAQKFSAIASRNMFWRDEVRKKGYDVAFTEWMRADHPWEFAAVCSKAAVDVVENEKSTGLFAKFQQAADREQTLKDEIRNSGEAAAFLDWLRDTHPDEYNRAIAKVGVTDASSKWSHETGIYGWGPLQKTTEPSRGSHR